jgi:hypothetical protein
MDEQSSTVRIALPGGLIAILALSGLTGACAGGPDRISSALPADCIVNRGVRDYDVLDDQNLIIYGPGSSAFHVEMTTPSNNLRSEIAVGILDNDGRICPYGGDAILVDGPIPERIPIRSIEALDEADVEALMVRYGVIEAAGDAVTVTQIQ